MTQRPGMSETAVFRYETYKKAFERMTIITIVLTITCAISIFVAWRAIATQPEPRYFVAREDGGIIPIVAVDRPYLNDGAVTNFATEAIIQALTLNFSDWRQQLAVASDYFERPNGWNNFLAAVEQAQYLQTIRNRRLLTSVVVNGAAIVQRGLSAGGRYTWTLQVPITVTYQSANSTQNENRLVEIDITRLPTWQTSRAVGVTRIKIQ